MRALTVGSLFAGVGGLDLGLERAGMQVRWQVEVDDFCQRVLAKHWPHVTRHRDVRDVGGHNLERVDVICGGFPCQDISGAGKRAGIDGERSGLWAEYARIIGELRPRYVLVENVAALLVRGLERVLGDLATRGYDAEWDCLPAGAFGAPHRRDRLFLVAYPQGLGWGTGRARGLAGDCEGQESARLPGRVADASSVLGHGRHHHAGGRGEGRRALPQPGNGGGAEGAGCGWWASEPDVGRVAHGVPAAVDEPQLRALGNAVVPQVAEWLGRRIVAHAEVTA